MGILEGVPVYELFEKVSDDKDSKNVNFFFISEGGRFVFKVVEYTYLRSFKGRSLFNFGFGDLDEFSNSISDDRNTENGDVFKVFHTVLATVPLFFEKLPEAIIQISGSDSEEGFEARCRLTCRKKCLHYCKNRNRRIRIYKGFIQKHLSEFEKHYELWESEYGFLVDERELVPFGNSDSSVCIYVKLRN